VEGVGRDHRPCDDDDDRTSSRNHLSPYQSEANLNKQERSIFPNFENLKGVLFGGPTSPTRPSDGAKKGQPDRHRKARTPLKDEFTEFSEYGSRFTLNQPDEKERKDKEKRDTTQDTEKDKSQETNQIEQNPPAPVKRSERSREHLPKTREQPDKTREHPAKTHEHPDKTREHPVKKRENPDITREQQDKKREQPDKTQENPDKTREQSNKGKQTVAEKFKLSEKLNFLHKTKDHAQPSLHNNKMLIQRHSTSSSPLTSLSVQQRQLPSTSTNPLTPLSVQQRQLPSTSTKPLTPLSVQQQKLSSSHKPHIKLNKIVIKSDSDSGYGDICGGAENRIKQVDIDSEYDLIQQIGEGWISRVYLAENRLSRGEIVLKAINANLVTAEEFYREFQHSTFLSSHPNILKIHDMCFQSDGFYIFPTEYAPLGDLTSNISENGIGELYTKRVASQIGAALGFIHSKKLCHMNVKLDNILVFRSDFSNIKLCDFGSVKTFGDIVIKKSEHLPYCPAELVAKHTNEYYQVDRVQDVFQFGIVVFFCLLGILPWQKADPTDPNFNDFRIWRKKKSNKIPRNFKSMTARAQKLFRKLLDPDPERRLELGELPKYLEDRWIRKGGKVEVRGVPGDHQSQLTLGSFQSVHSNAVEKNRMLYTLLQHGVETTVDRRHKTHRIINWIKQGAEREDSNTPGCDSCQGGQGCQSCQGIQETPGIPEETFSDVDIECLEAEDMAV